MASKATSAEKTACLEDLGETDEQEQIIEAEGCVRAALRHLKSAQRLLGRATQHYTEADCTDDVLALQEPYRLTVTSTGALRRAMSNISLTSE